MRQMEYHYGVMDKNTKIKRFNYPLLTQVKAVRTYLKLKKVYESLFEVIEIIDREKLAGSTAVSYI